MSQATNAAVKKSCPITRAEFRQDAKPLEGAIAGVPTVLEVKEFSSGGVGWYSGQKIMLKVAGKLVPCQVGINISVIGSKELPAD